MCEIVHVKWSTFMLYMLVLFPVWSMTRITLIATYSNFHLSPFTSHLSLQINKLKKAFYCRRLALFFKRFKKKCNLTFTPASPLYRLLSPPLNSPSFSPFHLARSAINIQFLKNILRSNLTTPVVALQASNLFDTIR